MQGGSINFGKHLSFRLDHGCSPLPVVICGFTRLDTRFAVIDPITRRWVDDGQGGEVWVKGDTVGAGYWGKPRLSQKVFQAVISDDNEGPYLRTGDLGMCKHGEFYITGRIKDITIIHGVNYAPQDIEQIAEESHEAVQPTGCAAFTIQSDGTEALVVVAELQRTWVRRTDAHQDICRSISTALYETFQLSATEIIFVQQYSIPRTSSGKLKRAQCRAYFSARKLARIPMPQKAQVVTQSDLSDVEMTTLCN